MARDPEAAIARTLILQCVATMVTGLIGAWSFSFAARVGEKRTAAA